MRKKKEVKSKAKKTVAKPKKLKTKIVVREDGKEVAITKYQNGVTIETAL